jgi:hypothetical protein
MKHKSGVCPAGLLLLVLLRQAHTRWQGVQSDVPPKPKLDLSARCLQRRPPIPCSYTRRLRRKVNDSLQAEPEAEILPEPNEVTNTRRWRKDPRGWHPETCKAQPKLLRK